MRGMETTDARLKKETRNPRPSPESSRALGITLTSSPAVERPRKKTRLWIPGELQTVKLKRFQGILSDNKRR